MSNKTKNDLIGFAIEKTIVEIGGSKMLYDVLSFLHNNYNCYLHDCVEHPGYLIRALKEHNGLYNVIMTSLQAKLEEYTCNKRIETFLQRINQN